MAEEEKLTSKWQPVMLIMPKRLECGECGALAVFVAMDMTKEEDDGYKVFDYGAYCQDCWQKVTEEAEPC